MSTVAFSDGGTVHDGGLFGNADRESGEIVFVFVVHARHFGGFAADQRGTGLYTAVGHTGHDLLKQCRVVLAAGDVVKEEQRAPAPWAGDVVSAHGTQSMRWCRAYWPAWRHELGATPSVPEMRTGSL